MGLKLKSTGGTGSVELNAPANHNIDTSFTLPTSNFTGGEWVLADGSGNVNIDSGTLYVDAVNDRVGVGTTVPANDLDVLKTASGSTTTARIGATAASGANNATLILNNGGTGNATLRFDYEGSTNQASIGVLASDQKLTFSTAGSTAATIDSSGRLLVGTTSGSGNNLLQVKGSTLGAGYPGGAFFNIGLDVASVDANYELGRLDFGNQQGYLGASIVAAADLDWNASDYPSRLVFSTTADGASSPTERMRIIAGGYTKFSNTGSYTNTTENCYEFNTNASNVIAMRIRHTGTSGQQYGLYLQTANDQNDSTRYFLQCVGSSTQRATIRSNGGLANYSANNANLCDEREKKNIETLDSTWNCLKNWELKKFHYNEDADTDDKRYGVIAQQVAPHCPEVITDWVKQVAADAELDDDGNVVTPAVEEVTRMGVKEQQMMWMAIKALQEAQTRIEQLEAKVAALEGGTTE